MRSDDRFEDALAKQTLHCVVHGGAKVGKTTFSVTAPKPLLLLDAEGGTKFLPLRKTFWDPQTSPPPVCDGSWDACVVSVNQWETLAYVEQWMRAGQHCFASMTVDSLSEIQRRCKRSLVGSEDMQQQHWGRLLTKIDDLVTELRDLTEHPTNPMSAVCFVTETKKKDEKWRPYLQGQMADSLPYKVDVFGYLFVADLADPIDPAIVHKQRQLLVGPDPNIEAGERVQGRLGHIVVEPNLCTMLDTVYGKVA